MQDTRQLCMGAVLRANKTDQAFYITLAELMYVLILGPLLRIFAAIDAGRLTPMSLSSRRV